MPTLNLAVKGFFFFFFIRMPHRPIAQKCPEVTAMSSGKDISPITNREKYLRCGRLVFLCICKHIPSFTSHQNPLYPNHVNIAFQ